MTALRHLGYAFLTGLVIFSAVRSEASVYVSHVGCPGISVASLQRSVAFYTGVLDFNVEGIEDSSTIARLEPGMPATTRAQTAHLVLGDECLDLTEYKSPRGRAYPTDSRGNDRWFQHIAIVVSNMDQAFSRVRTAGVRFVSNEPQTLPAWNKDAGGIKAFYFRDPDGHYLELIYSLLEKGRQSGRRVPASCSWVLTTRQSWSPTSAEASISIEASFTSTLLAVVIITARNRNT